MAGSLTKPASCPVDCFNLMSFDDSVLTDIGQGLSLASTGE